VNTKSFHTKSQDTITAPVSHFTLLRLVTLVLYQSDTLANNNRSSASAVTSVRHVGNTFVGKSVIYSLLSVKLFPLSVYRIL
jgi:hypothetical protein